MGQNNTSALISLADIGKFFRDTIDILTIIIQLYKHVTPHPKQAGKHVNSEPCHLKYIALSLTS